MTADLSTDERFATVEKFVHKLVWAFRQRYGLEVDDLRTEAFWGYMNAVQTYDGRTKFITWVGEKVKSALLDLVKRTASRRRAEYADLDTLTYRPQKQFDLDEILARLTPDARKIVTLVFETPVPVLSDLVELGETPANYRYALRCWLRDCGWGVARITETFTEIKEAL